MKKLILLIALVSSSVFFSCTPDAIAETTTAEYENYESTEGEEENDPKEPGEDN